MGIRRAQRKGALWFLQYAVVGRQAGTSRVARPSPPYTRGGPARAAAQAGQTVNPYCLIRSSYFPRINGVD